MEIAVISLGVALIIAFAVACFHAAGMRDDNNEKWSSRISLAESGLRVIAANHLLNLHTDISNQLKQDENEGFDPAKAVADPVLMVEKAKDYLKVIRVLGRIQPQFRLLLALGPIFLILLVILEIGLVGVFGHLGILWSNSRLYSVGLIVCTASGTLLIIAFALYAYLQHALSSAWILTAPARNDD